MRRLILVALVAVGCGDAVPEMLPQDAIPFGTVEMWGQVSPGQWQLTSFDNEPWPLPRDCGTPSVGGRTKIIEHWSGPDVAWTSCEGGFVSAAGNTFVFAPEVRPQVASFDAFVGPGQTNTFTIWRDAARPNEDRWIITGIPVPQAVERDVPVDRPSPRGGA